jgi:UrcA family protein
MQLFAFAQFSCALHQSFEKQPNAGQRHRFFVILSSNGVFVMRFAFPLLALAALAAPAVADDTVVAVRVPYADLDVTSNAGRAALESRVAAKLRKACSARGVARYNFNRTTRNEQCVADGLAAARIEVERVAAAQQRRGREVAAN